MNSGEQKRVVSDGGHGAVSDDRTSRISDRVQTLRLEKQPIDLGRSRRRWWLLLLLLLVIVVGGAYAYRSDALRDLFGPIEVESITVTYEQSIEVVLDTSGNVITPIVVDISPQVAGTVVELNLEVGKEVNKGDLLLRIDDGQYRAELDQAKATLAEAEARLAEALAGSRDEDIRQARAALEQAEVRRDLLAKELQRAQELKDTIAPAEYDRAEASYREAEANVAKLAQALELVELGPREEQIAALKADVQRAEALVRKAQFFCDHSQIRSPIDGTVLERSVELGEVIQQGMFATSIASIADLSRLEVEIEIQERDLAAIQVGQACLITPDAYPDRQYRGRLDRLAPMLNRQRGSRQANIVLANPDSWLTSNMNCRVQVFKKEPPEILRDVLRVPREAIQMENEQAFLFVAHQGTVRRRSVRLGADEGGKVEILDRRLSDGEEVLLPGNKNLQQGQPIRTRPRSNGNRD